MEEVPKNAESFGPPPEVGELLSGKYRIERLIGQGGMGVVLAAHHLHLDQRVAVKFLLPQIAAQYRGGVGRFLREARAMARIRSEHVARVLDVGTREDGAPYYVMEHLVGTDLGAQLKTFGALPIDDATEYVLQACDALAEAHAIGIVHRDLKPSNLFLARRADGSPTIKVLDFGIAKAPVAEAWTEGNLTGTGGPIGSPMYMSPEHLRSNENVDRRTDVWSLGIILHELLTGRHPFDATSPSGMCAMIAADPPAPLRRHRPDAPEGLEAAILGCLAKNRDERYGDVSELAAAIAPFAHARSQMLVERIARVTAHGGETQPSGPVKVPSLVAASSSAVMVAAGATAVPLTGAVTPPPRRRTTLTTPMLVVPLLLVIAALVITLLRTKTTVVEHGASSTPVPVATSAPALPTPSASPTAVVIAPASASIAPPPKSVVKPSPSVAPTVLPSSPASPSATASSTTTLPSATPAPGASTLDPTGTRK